MAVTNLGLTSALKQLKLPPYFVAEGQRLPNVQLGSHPALVSPLSHNQIGLFFPLCSKWLLQLRVSLERSLSPMSPPLLSALSSAQSVLVSWNETEWTEGQDTVGKLLGFPLSLFSFLSPSHFPTLP